MQAAILEKIYVFGGYTGNANLNEVFVLDTGLLRLESDVLDTLEWSRPMVNGPMPSGTYLAGCICANCVQDDLSTAWFQ